MNLARPRHVIARGPVANLVGILSGSIFGKLSLPPPNQTQPIRSVGDGTGRARQIWFALVPLSGLESKSP